jgi:hypothetical protein
VSTSLNASERGGTYSPVLWVKGSPVQIRPSRLVRASFRTQKQHCELPMGSATRSQQFGDTAVVRPVGDQNATGQQGPAEPAYGVLHPGALVSSQKAAGSPPALKAGFRQHQPGDPGGTRWQPRPAHCPATPSAVSARPFGRSLPPLAGLVQPSSAPLGLNSSPNLRICEPAPAAPDVLPVQMPHARGCPEADMHGDAAGAPGPQDPSQ